MLVPTNAASLITTVRLIDDAGDPITAVAYDDISLEVAVRAQSAATWTVLTLVDGTLGSYLASSWKADPDGDGLHQLCLPNSVVVAGTATNVRVTYGANAPQYDTIEARLPINGGTISEAVVVARLPIGATVGWPKEFIIGDARLTALSTAPKLYVKDIDDNILTALGSKNFTDADFSATLRLSPLTTTTRDLSEPPATIEVSTTDSPGIVYNDDTAGSEYFELQIPQAQAALGVVRTEYSCQFIMNWGNDDTYQSTINLGLSRFVRKNAAPEA